MNTEIFKLRLLIELVDALEGNLPEPHLPNVAHLAEEIQVVVEKSKYRATKNARNPTLVYRRNACPHLRTFDAQRLHNAQVIGF